MAEKEDPTGLLHVILVESAILQGCEVLAGLLRFGLRTALAAGITGARDGTQRSPGCDFREGSCVVCMSKTASMGTGPKPKHPLFRRIDMSRGKPLQILNHLGSSVQLLGPEYLTKERTFETRLHGVSKTVLF